MNDSDKEKLVGVAMTTMRELTFAQGVDLAKLIGMMQANRLQETMTRAMRLMVLKKIRDEKLYRNLPKLDGPGASTWDSFCPEYVGKDRQTAEQEIGMVESLGADVADAMFRLGLKPRQMHRLIEGGETTNEDLRKAITSAGDDIAALREDVNRILQETQAKSEQEIEKHLHRNEQLTAEIEKRKIGEARAEDTIRILTKKNRELESGWSPSADATEAIEQLEQINGTIGQQFAKITLVLARAGHHPEVRAHLMGILQADYDIEDGRVAQCRGELAEKMNEHARKAAKGKA